MQVKPAKIKLTRLLYVPAIQPAVLNTNLGSLISPPIKTEVAKCMLITSHHHDSPLTKSFRIIELQGLSSILIQKNIPPQHPDHSL